MSTRLIPTPEQRQDILSLLKKGPSFGDREKLAEYTQQVYKVVVGKELTPACDQLMAEWRRERRGKASPNESFVW